MRIELRLTEKCNYNCSYCTDLHNNKAKHIPFDYTGFDALLSKLDNPEVFIYGGEPTLHPECLDITHYLAEKGLSVVLQTNGSAQKIIRQIDSRVKLNFSYHNEHVSLIQFMRNMRGLEVNEIAFMSNAPDKEYHLLKRIYKERVQYCPLINSRLKDYNDNVDLQQIRYKDIFKHVQRDYHFIPHENGISNYEVWERNLDSKGRKCKIKENTLHVQNNKVYFCFNALMDDENGVPFSEYVPTHETIICPYNKCYFDIKNWVNEDDKTID